MEQLPTIVRGSWLGTRGYLAKHYTENGVILDSFLEDYIRDANHYQILIGNQSIGYFAIHGGDTLVAFHVFPEYGHWFQPMFAAARQYEQVTNAMVPTGDEMFLSLCLDNYSRIEKQAYFTLYTDKVKIEQVRPLTLTPADIEKDAHDLSLAPEFLEDKIKKIQRGNKELTIYLIHHSNSLVGFGNIEYSTLTQFASTGMMVLPQHRQRGYAKSILWYLNKEVLKNDRVPISGCWYYNHNSKKSMDSAGGYSVTRLLRFYF